MCIPKPPPNKACTPSSRGERLDAGDSAAFLSIFLGSSFFCSQAESKPAQHDKMVSLVTQMLELHKSKAGAKTQSEQDVYERQIRAVAARESIDELVY